jgi:predicted transcriptional regulator
VALAPAVATLRAALPSRPAARTTGPRQGTKQEAVLALLRRPEGATVAQIAEATGWANHTVRGFFAGLKKRQGITVEVLERVRQVGLNKQGAKGSYTIYRIAEAG